MVLSASQALALCRIGFGLYWLSQAFDKTLHHWLTDGSILTTQLLGNPNATPPTRGFAANADPFYRTFLESTLPAHGLLISQLVTIGEWVVGLSLLFGLLTRLGSIVGIWLNLNYMLMKGFANNPASNDRLFILAALAFILGAAGLVWGLDGLWRRQFGGNPITRWLAGLREPEEAYDRPRAVPVRESRRVA